MILLYTFLSTTKFTTLLWIMVNKNERKSKLLVTNYLQFTNWDWVCNAHVLSLRNVKFKEIFYYILPIIRIYDYVL